MPLEILGPIVVLGIVGIGVLLHLLGLSEPHRFATERDARARWDAAFPATPARGAMLCSDGTAALIETGAGPGVVWPMGADHAARFLETARIEARGDGLSIRLKDFTAPKIRLRLTPDELARWKAILEVEG